MFCKGVYLNKWKLFFAVVVVPCSLKVIQRKSCVRNYLKGLKLILKKFPCNLLATNITHHIYQWQEGEIKKGTH